MKTPGFISRRCADHFQPQVLTKMERKVGCHTIDTNITDTFVANLCLQFSGSVDGGLESKLLAVVFACHLNCGVRYQSPHGLEHERRSSIEPQIPAVIQSLDGFQTFADHP